MTQRATLLFLGILILASCKPKREDLIVRKWQEVSMTNPQLDEVMQSQKAFIDTVGSHTDAAANLRDYGVTDMDSFKQLMQANIDSFVSARARSVAATQFDFRKEGVVYFHSEEGIDSASWSFEEDGTLLLDEQKLKGAGSQLRVEVIALTDTMMNLKFLENNSASNTIFRPAKK